MSPPNILGCLLNAVIKGAIRRKTQETVRVATYLEGLGNVQLKPLNAQNSRRDARPPFNSSRHPRPIAASPQTPSTK
jgi:hypothetical protein